MLYIAVHFRLLIISIVIFITFSVLHSPFLQCNDWNRMQFFKFDAWWCLSGHYQSNSSMFSPFLFIANMELATRLFDFFFELMIPFLIIFVGFISEFCHSMKKASVTAFWLASIASLSIFIGLACKACWFEFKFFNPFY